jgi:hypothetical protein
LAEEQIKTGNLSENRTIPEKPLKTRIARATPLTIRRLWKNTIPKPNTTF